MKSALCILTSLLFIASAPVANGATVPVGFTDSVVAAGLTDPTAMAVAPDGRIFVCEQRGTLRVIKNGVLLGIAFDPNFVSNQLVYVYYTVPTPAHNRVSRFTASGDVALAGSEAILMEM